MAKTSKSPKKKKSSRSTTSRTPRVAPPSKPVEWTVAAVTRELNATSVDEDIALLKKAGILTKGGNLARRYTSWGNKVSRTPEINESGEMHD